MKISYEKLKIMVNKNQKLCNDILNNIDEVSIMSICYYMHKEMKNEKSIVIRSIKKLVKELKLSNYYENIYNDEDWITDETFSLYIIAIYEILRGEK